MKQTIELKGTIEFTYTNWKGKTSKREVIVDSIHYGTTSFHREPQMLLKGFCVDKGATRIFAMSQMQNVTEASGNKERT